MEATEKALRPKIKTFVEGFDELLGGGVPMGHIVLVTGQPGTMKSSFTYNILYHNALKNGMKGVYITLEQSRESLEEQMLGLGMDVESVEDKVSILDMGLIRKNLTKLNSKGAWLDVFKMYAKNLKESMDFGILVLDSLEVLEIMAKFQDKRTEMFYFFDWLRELGATVFLITETVPDSADKFDEGFLADGIIGISLDKVGDKDVQRSIRIYKMRATKHYPGYMRLLHEEGRFFVTQKITAE